MVERRRKGWVVLDRLGCRGRYWKDERERVRLWQVVAVAGDRSHHSLSSPQGSRQPTFEESL